MEAASTSWRKDKILIKQITNINKILSEHLPKLGKKSILTCANHYLEF